MKYVLPMVKPVKWVVSIPPTNGLLLTQNKLVNAPHEPENTSITALKEAEAFRVKEQVDELATNLYHTSSSLIPVQAGSALWVASYVSPTTVEVQTPVVLEEIAMAFAQSSLGGGVVLYKHKEKVVVADEE